jgi:Ca-activated chloride channel family protein
MSFHSPHFLLLFVPLLLLFSWELARHTARATQQWPKIARAWAGAFDVSLGTRHTTAETRPRLWLWFGLALCLVALARPQWGATEEQVFDQSREVLIAVDLSKSMLAQDVKPSRLERSKLLISSLLDGLKGERVGLVLFSGTAFLQSPLSADYEILREFLPALNPGYLPEGGTNYRAMLETSIQAFGTSSADRYLIVLSDGEATDEDWKPLVDSLKTKGIRVIGLGVGTAQGAFIPDTDGGLVKDERGAVVLSHLESATLQELAQVTGGAYADASSWVDLAALLRQTVDAGKKGQFSERTTARLVERFQWFLGPGLLLLCISFWAEFPVRPRERALPLGKAVPRRTPAGAAPAVAAAGLVAALVAGLTFGHPLRAAAPENPKDTFAAPLTATVTRLVGKDVLEAKDCAELAQTTLTYGQRMLSAQQTPPDGVIRDALEAVDRGEQLDAKAADWPQLRKDLEELRRKQEEKKQDQKKQDQQKQQQQQNQQNQDKQDQSQQNQNQGGSQDQQQQQNQQQKQQQQPPNQKDGAFGDMKDQQNKPDQPKPPNQPNSGTQKVGGQKEKKQEVALDPELALPLQKLDQVKNQDSPAQLQQLMRGPPEKPAKKGKDW